jgi:hypothetical protein
MLASVQPPLVHKSAWRDGLAHPVPPGYETSIKPLSACLPRPPSPDSMADHASLGTPPAVGIVNWFAILPNP